MRHPPVPRDVILSAVAILHAANANRHDDLAFWAAVQLGNVRFAAELIDLYPCVNPSACVMRKGLSLNVVDDSCDTGCVGRGLFLLGILVIRN